MDPYCIDDRERAVEEMLGDVQYFAMSEGGPNGPWRYKSLTIRREHNSLRILDVDGVLTETIPIEELTEQDDDPAHVLTRRLESINSETLADL